MASGLKIPNKYMIYYMRNLKYLRPEWPGTRFSEFFRLMHSGQKIRFFDEKRRQKCEISLEICKKLFKIQVFRK